MLVTNSDLQLEVVAVTVGRKTLAKRREIRGTQGTTEHAGAGAGLQQRIAEEIQYLAVAAVGVTLAVLASDMLMALLGAGVSVIGLARIQDRQIAALSDRGKRQADGT